MKVVHSLLLFLTLFTSIASFAMECGICLEPISAARPSVSMCPNKICVQAHPTCKDCWLNHFKENECVYRCKSTTQCVVCDKDFLKSGVVSDKRFCSLDCNHFVCYTCIKDKNSYACSVCNKNHDEQAIAKVRFPRNSGEAKKALEAYLLEKNKIKKIIKKPAVSIHHENCPICRQDKDVRSFASIGCSFKHRYCVDCLPNYLNHCDNCQICLQPIAPLQKMDLLARLNGDVILPSHKIFTFGACAVAVLPWIAYYWSKYRLQSTLYTVKTAAQTKTDMLLSFEFDCENGTFLGLQESFDINRILSALKTEKERITLKAAIEQYDIALNNAYNRIVNVYYYQPAVNFEKKEPQLVQKLHASTEQIAQLIDQYTHELGNPLRNMLFGVGAGVLSGIGILHITKS